MIQRYFQTRICSIRRYRRDNVNIKPIGSRDRLREDGSYPDGQFFIHQALDYRGVIMYSIPEHVYTFDERSGDYQPKEEVKSFMVLVDQDRNINY